MKTHNKLVRDKIPLIINKSGQEAVTRQLNDEEYRVYLEQKLQEEVDEYLADKNGEELADILEVLYTLAKTLQISPEELETLRKKKTQERGTFDKKILLVSVKE